MFYIYGLNLQNADIVLDIFITCIKIMGRHINIPPFATYEKNSRLSNCFVIVNYIYITKGS